MTMRIGRHVSIKNGYLQAAQLAHHLGSGAFQFFSKNPKMLSVKVIAKENAEACKLFTQKNKMISVIHSPYPTELCVDSAAKRITVINSIRNDLLIAEACGSLGVIVHYGKYRGTQELKGYQMMIDILDEILDDWKGDAMLLIENNAGQGSSMGTTLEEMMTMKQLVKRSDNIGFCFDTCHAFASGLWKKGVTHWSEKACEIGYLEHLKVIHLNDSFFPNGSKRDQHAKIGKGYMGEKLLKSFLSLSKIKQLPLILETPTKGLASIKEEISYVQALSE
jgi:deoxyribonuclease-4